MHLDLGQLWQRRRLYKHTNTTLHCLSRERAPPLLTPGLSTISLRYIILTGGLTLRGHCMKKRLVSLQLLGPTMMLAAQRARLFSITLWGYTRILASRRWRRMHTMGS